MLKNSKGSFNFYANILVMKHLVLSVVGVGLTMVLLSSTAHAATFTVTSTADDSAVNPGASCATVLPDCTLRSSIEAANAQAGADNVEFNISGGGVHTLTPGSSYPQIVEQLSIDGSTQPGSSCGELIPSAIPVNTNSPSILNIEVDGSLLSPGSDFWILNFNNPSSNNVIRGLILNRFTTPNNGALTVYSNGGDTIECNYIGTDSSGTLARANSIGIFGNLINSIVQNNLISGNTEGGIGGSLSSQTTIANNLIGTTTNGMSALPNGNGFELYMDSFDLTNHILIRKNIVSGNIGRGILATRSRNVSYLGNFIGVNLSGSPLGNGGNGLDLDSQEFGGSGSQNNIIGGTNAADRNIISANGNNGLRIYGRCTNSDSHTFGNYIGTNLSGEVQSGYGNGRSGVEVSQGGSCSASFITYNHQIGGDNAGESNIIAGNAMDGAQIFEGLDDNVYSISVLNNKIFGNGNLGVNLAADEDNNRVADAYLGPNDLNNFLMSNPTMFANYFINHPTINSASVNGNDITVNYSLNANQADDSTLSQSDVAGYRLDFYISDSTQDGAYAGYSQGKTHLGSFIVDNSESNASHTFTSPVSITANMSVNATTTVLWKVAQP